jgi:hypothetical protein
MTSALVVVVLLLAFLIGGPGALLLLSYIADWRAFSPGTGPHRWERALFPAPDDTRRKVRGPPLLPRR